MVAVREPDSDVMADFLRALPHRPCDHGGVEVRVRLVVSLWRPSLLPPLSQ